MILDSWVAITVLAAFFQNARSALQKYSANRLSVLGASYVRFLFALPFAIVYLIGLIKLGQKPIPIFNVQFLLYCIAGGISQIFFTVFLVSLFTTRNFAVGTVYSKTEIVQVALLGYFILGESLGDGGLLAVCSAGVGVLLLTVGNQKITFNKLIKSTIDKSALVGLASGAALGASVVFYRGAALSLEYTDSVLVAAAYTLTIALIIQTFGMGALIYRKEVATFSAIAKHWKGSLAVGTAGILASIAWFTAFTMHNAAHVRALGQIELVFTFLVSVVIFREKTNLLEFGGIFFIIVAVVMLVLP